MEELDLNELFSYIKEKFSYIILGTILICLLGALYALFIQKPIYRSSTTLVLASASSGKSETGITQSDVLLNQNLVDTYREIVKSKKVLTQVINNLKLEDTVESLADKISVSSISNTEIIRISVTDQNAAQAKNIANNLAKVFSNEVVYIYNIKNISILDAANTPTSSDNINVPKQFILYLLVGFLLSFSVVFATWYFDTTIKSAEQVEEKIGLPILGSVPMRGKKSRRGRS